MVDGFEVGDRVVHQLYGRGRISGFEPPNVVFVVYEKQPGPGTWASRVDELWREFQAGETCGHEKLGLVKIKTINAAGTIASIESCANVFDGTIPMGTRYLERVEGGTDAGEVGNSSNEGESVGDVVGSVAQLVQGGEIGGIGVVTVTNEGMTGSAVGGSVGDGRAVVGELSFLADRVKGLASQDGIE